MRRTLKPLAAASLALLLAACGQTGALYLPDESQQIVVRERDASNSPEPANSPTAKGSPETSGSPASSDGSAVPPPLT
jgi:predicted small lipoprotein YifL